MKNVFLTLITFLFLNLSFSQSWIFVGNESFSGKYCWTVKLANYGPIMALVTDPYDDVNFTNYVMPYQFNGTNWVTYLDTIYHPIFSTYELNPDIDMNTTNQHFILTFGGPNKSYLYQTNFGQQKWDLVDSLMVNHDDLETGLAGNMYMSGYAGVYEHVYNTGAHTDYFFSGLYSFGKLTVDNSHMPYAFHATSGNGYELNELNGGVYTELDSINYGSSLSRYDNEVSDNQPVYVHLDPTNDKILLSKYNGSGWDTVYVDNSNSYTFEKVQFNLAVDDNDQSIYVGVNSVIETTSPSNSTDQTIKVFKVSSDLSTETDLGVVANFTYPTLSSLRDFDVEFKNNKLYCAYVNFADSARVSVKTYDQTSDFSSVSEASFNLFPNPANDYITIESNNEFYNYQIFDLSGQLLLEGNGSLKSKFDVNQLESGLYLIQLSDGNSVIGARKFAVE